MKDKVFICVFVVACLFWQVQGAVNCTETGAGRFVNPDDTTCKNYTLCVYSSSTSTYLSYNYVCPSTSIFNNSTHLCTDSASYTCNITTTTTNTTSVCTADGYVADPDSTNCTTYILCVEINGTFVESTETCPDDTYFNPNTTNCETDYNCTTTTNTTSTTTFTCSAAGRFADSSDDTCQTYYMCVLTSTGEYTQYTYTCPSTSVFNPTTKVCTSSYTCGS